MIGIFLITGFGFSRCVYANRVFDRAGIRKKGACYEFLS